MLLDNKEFAEKNIEKVRFEKQLDDSVQSSDLSEGEMKDKFGSEMDSDQEFEDELDKELEAAAPSKQASQF